MFDPMMFYSYASIDLGGYWKISWVFRPTQQGNFDTLANNIFETLITNAPHYLLNAELQAKIKAFRSDVIPYDDITNTDWTSLYAARVLPHAPWLISTARMLHGRGGHLVTEITNHFGKYMDMMLMTKDDCEDYGYYRVNSGELLPPANLTTGAAAVGSDGNIVAPTEYQATVSGVVGDVFRAEEMEWYKRLLRQHQIVYSAGAIAAAGVAPSLGSRSVLGDNYYVLYKLRDLYQSDKPIDLWRLF